MALSVEFALSGCSMEEGVVSGDLGFVQHFADGALFAVIDGLGHGTEAAAAAKAAETALKSHIHEDVSRLFQVCHQELKKTRGAAMSLALFDSHKNTLSWAGVGNVEGVLLRGNPDLKRESLLLRNGIVGFELPTLRVSTLHIEEGDTLVFATDGIHSGFSLGLEAKDSAQELTDRILKQFNKHTDDALVLGVKFGLVKELI